MLHQSSELLSALWRGFPDTFSTGVGWGRYSLACRYMYIYIYVLWTTFQSSWIIVVKQVFVHNLPQWGEKLRCFYYTSSVADGWAGNPGTQAIQTSHMSNVYCICSNSKLFFCGFSECPHSYDAETRATGMQALTNASYVSHRWQIYFQVTYSR